MSDQPSSPSGDAPPASRTAFGPPSRLFSKDELVKTGRKAYAARDLPAFVEVVKEISARALPWFDVKASKKGVLGLSRWLPIVDAAMEDGRVEWLRAALAHGAPLDASKPEAWINAVRRGELGVVRAVVEHSKRHLCDSFQYHYEKSDARAPAGQWPLLHYALTGGPAGLADVALARFRQLPVDSVLAMMHVVSAALQHERKWLGPSAERQLDFDKAQVAMARALTGRNELAANAGMNQAAEGEKFDKSAKAWISAGQKEAEAAEARRAEAENPCDQAKEEEEEEAGLDAGPGESERERVAALEAEVKTLRERLAARTTARPAAARARPTPSRRAGPAGSRPRG